MSRGARRATPRAAPARRRRRRGRSRRSGPRRAGLGFAHGLSAPAPRRSRSSRSEARAASGRESRLLIHLHIVPGRLLPGGLTEMFVSKAAVVGGGTMGGEIAQAIAAADIPVVVKDIDQKFV